MTQWPKAPRAPDAIPFVSLYADGVLVGCQGADEGAPGERIARAFLRAMNDARFRREAPMSRGDLAAEITYVRAPTACSVAEGAARIVPGLHGVGLARGMGAPPVLLLPRVACDGGLGSSDLIVTLFTKAQRDLDDAAELVLFEAESASSHSGRGGGAQFSPTRAAAAWLSRAVAANGHVTFCVDARARTTTPSGPFQHGRAAIVARALGRRNAAAAKRARERLARDARAGLRGSSRVAAWPEAASEVAGTLALAILAGVDLTGELRAFARAQRDAIASAPWHAAQVVHALGAAAPARLFESCRADLSRAPFAPWTLLAARSLGDASVVARATHALHASVRSRPPGRGAVGAPPYEVAMAALALEALASDRSKANLRVVAQLRAFLLERQLAPGRIPAALDPELAAGAFPLSTMHDHLRSDVTAHALWALEHSAASESQ
ncbi:MAG: AMMECR1 domain-containing protein [Deltaproteobacteria bacterium]|nr:AMMECR1 domain-containing protein [Deltaproteobacteria bacterium]